MTERSPLLDQVLQLDPLLTELEGVASAMLAAGCEEVPIWRVVVLGA